MNRKDFFTKSILTLAGISIASTVIKGNSNSDKTGDIQRKKLIEQIWFKSYKKHEDFSESVREDNYLKCIDGKIIKGENIDYKIDWFEGYEVGGDCQWISYVFRVWVKDKQGSTLRLFDYSGSRFDDSGNSKDMCFTPACSGSNLENYILLDDNDFINVPIEKKYIEIGTIDKNISKDGYKFVQNQKQRYNKAEIKELIIDYSDHVLNDIATACGVANEYLINVPTLTVNNINSKSEITNKIVESFDLMPINNIHK